ncbi:uncharacterized protein LOC135943221 [Cloeon dipterum]|uniref:uncharacterized protein LOC135943221 n=1 Tax=Cloeon dipterum TaxID=197152 RepID=UPI00321FA0FF
MVCLLPRLCGVRTHKWAFIICIIDLALHILLLTICVKYIAAFAEEMKNSEETVSLKSSGEQQQSSENDYGDTIRSNGTLENLSERVVELLESLGESWDLGEKFLFYLAIVGAVYELFCIPSILCLAAGLCCRTAYMSVPWLVKTVVEIGVVIFLIVYVQAEEPIVLAILLAYLGHELLGAFLVLSGVSTMNGSMDMTEDMNGEPAETELKLLSGSRHEPV